ncbi:MAG: exonuclease SbcCD subunit D [Methanothrix sp.]
MRVVHIADTHLGFQSFSRMDEKGRNLMEECIYRDFRRAIERIIELKPDAVVHAGDVFHHVRPRIRPLCVFKQSLESLSNAGIPVIVISGNHDAPKSYSALSPFYLYDGMKDVYIAHRYRYERFEVGDHVFHCIPFCFTQEDYLEEFRKIDMCGSDVLVMHGLVEALRDQSMNTVGEHIVSDSFLKSDFSYIALGHYHDQRRIAQNTWYSGSIEYFNFNEAPQRKGALMVDLSTGEVESIGVPNVGMRVVELDCSGKTAEEILDLIEEKCGEDKNKIVRVDLRRVNRAAYRRMDQRRLSRLASSMFCLKIKPEYDEVGRAEDIKPPERLDLEFVRFLEAEMEKIPNAIRQDVMSYGTELIRKVIDRRGTEGMDASQ